MQRLLLLLLALGIGILGCQANCRTCASGSNVACISETQFQFCVNNQTTGPVNSCPSGSFCTSQTSICQKNETLKSCRGCNQCDDQRIFACTGASSFALCLGGKTPSNSVLSCPSGNVCNIDLPSICGNATTTQATCNDAATTAAPTTAPPTTAPPTTAPPTTQRPPTSVNEFCRTAPKGIPVHAIPNDTLCNGYIYCRYYINSWIGRIFSCPPEKPYFNGITLCCGTTKPTLPGCI